MKKDSIQYDYIICGAGCAGLSLSMHLSNTLFRHKKILILDKDEKTSNDRTWCFWDKSSDIFSYDDIVSHSWPKIRISDQSRRFVKNLDPLEYKRIKSLDFYEKAKGIISQAPNIEWKKEEVVDINEDGNSVVVTSSKGDYSASYCFNSIPKSENDQKEYLLKQHFLGWIIEFDKEVFEKDVADLMDFRMPQEDGVRFSYVLPFSRKRAMIELTIFSESLLNDQDAYELLLKKYIEDEFGNISFKIVEKEFGVIPMSTSSYYTFDKTRIINIGNSSGRIKPSSGYAFKRIQEEIDHLARSLRKNIIPKSLNNKNRFLFYDKILFNVLLNKRMRGDDVFTTMFEKNSAAAVLKFLGEKTNIIEEALIFSRLPIKPFLKAMISELIRRISNK